LTCGEDTTVDPDDLEACRPRQRRVAIESGMLLIGPSDWEAQGIVTPRTANVATFMLDANEVTAADWRACVRAAACVRSQHRVEEQDGARAAILSFSELAKYCAW
jgi:formylglycine-generating enzyme required for sulfatase activity